MDKTLELLTIGDATMDVFLSPTESETLCTLNDKECHICFSYGEKIPVSSIEFSIGGNAANNSVGASRLGLRVGVVSTLGADQTGNEILQKLKEEGVDLSFVVQQPNADSNYSTVITYGGERTIFTYHAPRSYEFPVHLSPAPWMYLTSMGESSGPFIKHLLDFLSTNSSIKLAFNPGSRQLRDKESIVPIMKRTHVIYVNRQEAETLTGIEDSQGKDKELLKALSDSGPEICIVTDGGEGSYVYDSRQNIYLHAGVLPVDAYERTGAGDAFGSACISALIKGRNFEEALLWGTVNSASVIGYTGAQKGLLKEDDIFTWLERAKSSDVKVEEF